MPIPGSEQPVPPIIATLTTQGDDVDIDPETIQSTVDTSFSLALSLVQSWIPAGSSTPLDPSIVQARKRVEEYMRRPPRLGVGAPMPTTQHAQPTHHETQQLKNRLVGSGTARRKAEEEFKLNGSRSHPSKRTGSEEKGEDDDESESRAGAMTKKQKKQGRAMVNGLSVFGSGSKMTMTMCKPMSGAESGTKPKTEPEAGASTAVQGQGATPPTTPTHVEAHPASTCISSPDPTSISDSPLNVIAETATDPRPGPDTSTSEQPMEIHKLPSKLPLAAKIWPYQSRSSPSGSDTKPHSKRRRTITSMLPPPSPSLAHAQGWTMTMPMLPHSRSGSSAGSVTSSVPSSSLTTEPHRDSATHLSRKERKRLRKAMQEPDDTQENQALANGDRKPASSGQSVHASPPHSSSVAVEITSARRSEPPERDDSSQDEEDVTEMVSPIDEAETLQNDTVREKKKRKRRARKRSGASQLP